MSPYALNAQFKSGQDRIDWVDYAKGFCIIFVVMMHSTLGVEKYGDGIGWMNAVVTFAQPFRMPDFFMISGLFLGLVIGRSWLRYFDRKVIHYLYFFVLWLTIQFAFRVAGGGDMGNTAGEIAGNFFLSFLEPYGTLWFIYMLPIMFLVTRILEKVNWLVVLALAAVFEIAPIHTGSTMIDEFAGRYVYFFAGYVLAQPIFQLAGWARENISKAVVFLVAWALVNGFFTFTAIPSGLELYITNSGWSVPSNIAQLPIISLVLGIAGAIAIICLCAIFSRFKFAAFLRYLGENSIAVYLAFFLPMVITRVLLLKYAPGLGLGNISVIVTAAAVIGPVILFEFTRRTGLFTFLFKRPSWAWVDRVSAPRKASIAPQPAE